MQTILSNLDVLALAAIMIAGLWWMQRRAKNRLRQQRAGFFSRCMDMFSDVRQTQDEVEYPVLEGTYADRRVRLEPVCDQMALRKLPTLWISVTLFRPLPCKGVFDFVVRPSPSDFYSPWMNLPVDIEVPRDWPANAVLRTDNPEGMPSADRLTVIRDAFEDPFLKEVVISPKGVRIVYLADESQRSHYLVLRQPQFLGGPLDPELLQRLLNLADETVGALVIERQQEATAA